jgi:hypothetical protein
LAYEALLDIVNRTPDLTALQTKFQSWVGKHINNTTDPKELALGLYKSLYSPAFKDWFGSANADWEKVAEAISHKSDVKGIYKDIFEEDPQQIMFEGAVQANSSASEKEGITKALGENIVKLSQELFPNSKVGDFYVAKLGNLDINGEPLITDDAYTNYNGDKKDILNKQISDIYQQADSTLNTIPPRASRETIAKMKEFLKRMNVEVESVANIVVNGKKLNVNGIADPLNKLIQITEGKEDIALPEEAMHVAVELIQNTDNKLFNQMMNEVGKYPLYGSIFQQYSQIYRTADDKPDVPKIKKEAIAKILATTIINNDIDHANTSLIAKVLQWWKDIINKLKEVFLKTNMNPFEQAIDIVNDPTQKTTEKVIDDHANHFFQLNTNNQADLSGKLIEQNKNIVRLENGNYEINGIPVRHTVEENVFRTTSNPILKARRGEGETNHTLRKGELELTEDKVKADISNIFHRLVNDQGELRNEELPREGVSIANPLDDGFYLTMRENMLERLNGYPEGTKFFNDLNVYDEVSRTAGTIDFLAIKPDDKIDIIQFKTPFISPKTGEASRFSQEDYRKELTDLKKILIQGYNVKFNNFELSRVIPIRATFDLHFVDNTGIGGEKTSIQILKGLSIGNVNAKLIKDEALIPIPSENELTGDTKFDTFISKLYGLLQKTIDTKVPPEQKEQRRILISSLYRGIKRLQVQKNATGVISAGKTLVARESENFKNLKDQIDNIDPENISIEKLGDIGKNLIAQYDEIAIYTTIDRAFDNIFEEDTPENKKIIEDASKLRVDAEKLNNKFEELAVNLRKKSGGRVGIVDEFRPEKQLTLYRTFVRSLAQSSTNAGRILSRLVRRINDNYRVLFTQRLKQVQDLENDVKEWMKGKTLQNLYHTFFQYNDKNKWTGKVVQKYGAQFYKDLRDAQEKGNKEWVKNNVDMEAYTKWFRADHVKMIEKVKAGEPYDADPAQSKAIAKKILTNYSNNFDPGSPFFVNTSNYKLRDFPKDSAFSDAYKNLLKPENKPVLNLWKHWQNRLTESEESGMLQSTEGKGFFPNVRKSLGEKLFTAKGGNKLKTFLFGDLLIDAEDEQFGKLDPINKKPMSQIHASFVSDLGELVKETDEQGNTSYFRDFGEKSMDIFKVLALWDREILRYNLRTESEGIAQILAFTERNRTSYKVTNTGKILKSKDGTPIEDTNNDKNAKYLQDHIDAAYYGIHQVNESDFEIKIPLRSIAEKLNKIAGTEVMSVPDEQFTTISGMKGLNFINRFFALKTLGVSTLSPLANLFGGTTNSYINQGRYFNKTDLNKAELQLVSGRFYSDEQRKKLAGFLAYIDPFLEDKTMNHVRDLSLSKAVQYFSSDHLMFMLRGSDNWVNQVIAISFINNAIVRDGKIQNAREVARTELGHDKKWSGSYEEGKAFDELLEKRVSELLSSPEALLNKLQVSKDKLVLPGINLEHGQVAETVSDFRSQIMEFIKDALGNTSRDDLSLYKRSVIMQSFAMFKNWIPRMVDVRFQSLKYSAGSNHYEWGRMRMLGNAVRDMGMRSVSGLFKSLGGNDKTIVETAKKQYITQRNRLAEQQEDFNITEAEFVDMYIKGVSAQFKELGLALGLIGVLMAARAFSPDPDDDPTIKGSYKYLLRAVDKLQDEISFFYNPQSFSDIINGSIFPAAELLLEVQRFLGSSMTKAFDLAIGNEAAADKQHPAKYFFKMMPITKELVNYIAILNEDFAKKYDIRISSKNGSSR